VIRNKGKQQRYAFLHQSRGGPVHAGHPSWASISRQRSRSRSNIFSLIPPTALLYIGLADMKFIIGNKAGDAVIFQPGADNVGQHRVVILLR
jgi:hypothetical protein